MARQVPRLPKSPKRRVKVSFKQVDGKIHYALEDNENNKTEYANSGVDASKLANGVKLSLANGEFKLDTATLSATGIVTKSFYKNMANLSYGVKGVDSQGEDAIVCITKINDQSLITSNSKFENTARVNPVIIPMEDGVDEPITSAVATPVKVNAPANKDYTFAYYCLDVLGTGWAVEVGDSGKVSGKTSHAIGEVGSQDIVAKIYATDASDEALITLNITAVEDETSVTISDSAFENFYSNADKLQNVFGSNAIGHMVATTEGNTFEFPHMSRDDFNAIYTTDDYDTFNNVKIVVKQLTLLRCTAILSDNNICNAHKHILKRSFQLGTNDAYVKVPFTKYAYNLTNVLTISENGILIPAGVRAVKVSAQICLGAATAGVRYAQISKKSWTDIVARSQRHHASSASPETHAIPSTLLTVKEGDIIILGVYGNASDWVYGNYNQTYLMVEAYA